MSAIYPIIMASVFTFMSFTVHAQCQQIVVVRHAEKVDDGTTDPPLSLAGIARAERLLGILKGTDIVALYATQYQRTQQTLAPLAKAHNLDVQIRPIDEGGPRAQAANIAHEVQQQTPTGAVVIAGHSNTVDDLAAAFGGPAINELEHRDYDSIFVIHRCEGAPAQLRRHDFSRAIAQEQ